jgi:hypothetical protein
MQDLMRGVPAKQAVLEGVVTDHNMDNNLGILWVAQIP